MNSQFDSYRRRSSFSGSGFGPGSGFPPHTEAAFRPGREGFNDVYNNGYPEVSGPPNYPPPPPNSGLGPSFPNGPNGPPPPMSQSFSSGGGLGFPPPGGMASSFPMTREPHPFNDSPDMGPTGFAPPPPAYPNSYDNSPLSDNHVPPLLDDGFGGRGRSLSTGGGFGPPALLPPAPPMTPYPSHYSGKRMRRASSVGPGMGLGGYVPDSYHRPGGRVAVKFRLKGAGNSGVTLDEVLAGARMSQSTPYLLHDIAPDMYGKLTLKVRWSGYRSNTYTIPLSTDYSGYVNLPSLARRTARAITHFMQQNGIILPYNRVVIHRLEETSPGIWIPVLMTH